MKRHHDAGMPIGLLTLRAGFQPAKVRRPLGQVRGAGRGPDNAMGAQQGRVGGPAR